MNLRLTAVTATAALALAACGTDDTPLAAPSPTPTASSAAAPSPSASDDVATRTVCEDIRAAATPRSGYTPDPAQLARYAVAAKEKATAEVAEAGRALELAASAGDAGRARLIVALLAAVEACKNAGY